MKITRTYVFIELYTNSLVFYHHRIPRRRKEDREEVRNIPHIRCLKTAGEKSYDDEGYVNKYGSMG
jgi:hypothetical protein